jgi:curved DNA-binding protein CbpA
MTNFKASVPPRAVGSSSASLPPQRTPHHPVSSGQHLSPPPASGIAAQVLARHAQLSRFTHFELLEVSEAADQETIRRAFNQAVRRFHPDLLCGEDERLRPLAQEIVCRIGAALRVLEDPSTRRQYLQSLRSVPSVRPSQPGFRASSMPSARPSQPGFRASSMPGARASQPGFRASSMPHARASQPGVRASTPAGLRARRSSVSMPAAGGWTPEQAFAAACIQLKRGASQEAMVLAEQACAAEPENPQYRALHAWLRVERGELQPGPAADEILATLTWAVRERRTDLEIRLYRGRVLSRLGRRAEAIRDFSVVASMDEKNLEAIREVRLYRAREEQAAANSGVFSKLFKRS